MQPNPPSTTSLVVLDDPFTAEEAQALAGFLGGYSGLTRQAYTHDLRQFATWCGERRLALFAARRSDIESFARHLEELGRARSTIARRLCTITCFYRYAEQEGLLVRSPAVHVRRPRVDYESHAVGLDRNEVGALLVAAGLASARDHALISLLALNGLRVSEAVGADIERLGLERGHRILVITRKGGKVVTIPLAPRTARAINLAVGERSEGPIFLVARRGDASTAMAPAASSAAWPGGPGSPSGSVPTRSATPSSPPPSTPASPSGTSRRRRATPIRERRCAMTEPACRSIATPRTSSRRSSPAQAADPRQRRDRHHPFCTVVTGAPLVPSATHGAGILGGRWFAAGLDGRRRDPATCGGAAPPSDPGGRARGCPPDVAGRARGARCRTVCA
jgi:integrase/recombinase XerD